VSWAAAFFGLFAFLYLFRLMRVPARASEVVSRARRAVADLRDRDLPEDAKERAMQAHSIRLFQLFLVVTGCALVALAVPAAIIAILGAAGVVDVKEVLELTTTWPFLIAATAAALVAWIVARTLRSWTS
jgi:hypothetical protein